MNHERALTIAAEPAAPPAHDWYAWVDRPRATPKGNVAMIALRVAKGVRVHFIQRLWEWFLAGHLGIVGAQLIRTDVTFRTSQAYRVIADYVSETAWSGVALGISLFWLLALILNGSFDWFSRWSRWVRSLSAFVVSGFWTVSAIGMFDATPLSPAFIDDAGYAVMAFIVSLVTAHEVGAADKRAKHAASGG